MRKPVVLAAATSLLLVSCAGSYRPIVDMKGVDSARYEQDLAECRAYADEVSPGGQAVAGGVVTAALGAAIGAIAGAFGGSAGTGAAAGAAIGGVTGTTAGGVGGVAQQQEVIDRCLAGRGYSVLSR
jgi:hypothetical protein